MTGDASALYFFKKLASQHGVHTRKGTEVAERDSTRTQTR